MNNAIKYKTKNKIPSRLLLLRFKKFKLTKDDHDGGKVPIVIVIINY